MNNNNDNNANGNANLVPLPLPLPINNNYIFNPAHPQQLGGFYNVPLGYGPTAAGLHYQNFNNFNPQPSDVQYQNIPVQNLQVHNQQLQNPALNGGGYSADYY